LAFYFPLRLRTQTQRPGILSGNGAVPGESANTARYVECQESEAFCLLNTPSPATHSYSLLLGEPGSGKSTLLKEWFKRAASGDALTLLGLGVPVLVRLRDVPISYWSAYEPQELADILWQKGLAASAYLSPDWSNIYSRRSERLVSPFWLLDGLDELPLDVLNETLYSGLATLPGRKLLTCRTATYGSLRREADQFKQAEFEIVGLTLPEQSQFLAIWSENNSRPLEQLEYDIARNIQLRQLAENPFMLDLMAEVASAKWDELNSYPMGRSDFYRKAINSVWHRKLHSFPAELRQDRSRDVYLAGAASKMGVDKVQTELRPIDEILENALRLSGIIRINEPQGTFEFSHLMFQEYYLAKSLEPCRFNETLALHWTDPRWEETLGVLVSSLCQSGREKEVVEGLSWLLKHGETAHNGSWKTLWRQPKSLWKIRRSPARLIAHILSRSAIKNEDEQHEWLPQLHLLVKPSTSILRLLAMAADPLTPLELLNWFVQFQNDDIRKAAASNPALPIDNLARLTHDPAESVRVKLARISRLPLEHISVLASDQSTDVRAAVADRADLSFEVQRQLAQDPSADVRRRLASNESIHQIIAAKGMIDDNEEVSRAALRNPRLFGASMLDKLAKDPQSQMRVLAARHNEIPAELLVELAKDESPHVRAAVGENPRTPTSVLELLALDPNSEVRAAAASNLYLSESAMSRLARDADSDVRMEAARNKSCSPEILSELASDSSDALRMMIALHPRTPPETLMKLARFEDEFTPKGLACNPRTPPEVLHALFSGFNSLVRYMTVIINHGLPPDLLALLLKDMAPPVRLAVALHQNVLLEDL